MAAVYTVKQVAEILGYSTNSIYTFLKEKRIKGVRVGRGRFRIPQGEVNRLLLISKSEVKLTAGPVSEISLARTAVTAKPPALDLPSLFDWFLAAAAIVIGAAMLVWSRTYNEFFFEQYVIWLPSLRIILVASGVGLLYADLSGRSRSWWHRLFRLILIGGFGGLALISGIIGDMDNLLIYSSIAFIALLDTVIEFNSVLVITIYVLILGFIGPLSFILAPNDPHIAALLKLLPVGRYIAAALIWSLTLVGTVLIFLGLRLWRWLYWVVIVTVAVIFLGTAYLYASELFWGRAFFFLILAFTCFFIPFWQTLVLSHKADRKIAYLSYAAVLGLFILTIGILKIIQDNMQHYASLDLVDKVDYAKILVSGTLEEVKSGLSRSAQDPVLLEATQRSQKEIVLGLARDISDDNQALRRLLILNSKGDVLAFYPRGSQLLSTNYSQRDYFIAATQTKKAYLSPVFEANTTEREQVVVVAVPILDRQKEVAAVLVGSLDLVRLNQRLAQVTNEALGEYFEMVDTNGKWILYPEKEKIGQPAGKIELALKGASGKHGTGFSYGVGSVLVLSAYDQIEGTGWGVAAVAPMSKVLSAAKTSFLLIVSLTVLTLLVAGGSFWIHREHFRIGKNIEPEDTS